MRVRRAALDRLGSAMERNSHASLLVNRERTRKASTMDDHSYIA